MSALPLDALLHASQIAVVGGSAQTGSIGHALLTNIVAGGFAGTVYAVNPHPVAMPGVSWVSRIEDLPASPELTVIATPPDTVPEIITRLAAVGGRLAVVITSGVDRHRLLEAAQAGGVRLIGPNGIGVLIPRVQLNASFVAAPAPPGGLALLSQSGAVVGAMVEEVERAGFGFSGAVSLGEAADLGFAELLDLFAADPATHAILLYLEGLSEAQAFMSAAGAASRLKPVIALKAGISTGGIKAARSHTGALAGSYDVHRAAFRRAGVVVVDTMAALLDAAKLLCTQRTFDGRLAVVTNGGGAGVLAADACHRSGLSLAPLQNATLERLDTIVPGEWSRANPVDVRGDATSSRLAAAVSAVLADPFNSGVLVAPCPTAIETGDAVAAAVADAARGSRKPVAGCWLGPANAALGASALHEAEIPLFSSVEAAVEAFSALRDRTEMLAARTAPPAPITMPAIDPARAHSLIGCYRTDGRGMLTAAEARTIAAAYGIPVTPMHFAHSPEEVAERVREIDGPCVVKIVSPDLSHKSDLGGVALDLNGPDAAARAAREMERRIRATLPQASIWGFEVAAMAVHGDSHEILAGFTDDPVFGPVLAVGTGGTAAEVIADRALDIPPLNDASARAMIGRTRVAKLLAGYRNMPAADVDGLVRILNALSQMAIDLPDLSEFELNPLLVGPNGILALDVRARLAREPARRHLAICPPPIGWEVDLVTRGGVALHVRAARAGDEDSLQALFDHVAPEDLRFRFLSAVRSVARDQVIDMTRTDFRRAVNFLAFEGEAVVASAMLAINPGRTRAELAVSVRADRKGKGVGWSLADHALRYAQAEGIDQVEAIEDAANRAALTIEREMGFSPSPQAGPERVMVRTLEEPTGNPQLRPVG